MTRVMGIDCGTEFTGFGVVEELTDARRRTLKHIASGVIKLRMSDTLADRLAHAHQTLCAVIEEYEPEIVVVEEVFYSVNAKSALKLGHVRGVALLAAANCKRPVSEYSPLAVKSAVVGYGRAEKRQVQEMVGRLLGIDAPESEDEGDALAIAICHLHTAGTLNRQKAAAQR